MSDASAWIAPLFPEEEVPHILRGLQRCLAGLKKEYSGELENPITKRLFRALCQDQSLRDRPFKPDLEVYEDGCETNIEGRLDIRFLVSTGTLHPWPYLAVEAKRLHVQFPSGWKSLVSEYVTGHQGMMCFISGRYSGTVQCAIMVGYVFDGEVAKALRGIASSIADNAKMLAAMEPAVLRPVSKIDRVRHSMHRRVSGEFTIYHLFQAV